MIDQGWSATYVRALEEVTRLKEYATARIHAEHLGLLGRAFGKAQGQIENERLWVERTSQPGADEDDVRALQMARDRGSVNMDYIENFVMIAEHRLLTSRCSHPKAQRLRGTLR